MYTLTDPLTKSEAHELPRPDLIDTCIAATQTQSTSGSAPAPSVIYAVKCGYRERRCQIASFSVLIPVRRILAAPPLRSCFSINEKEMAVVKKQDDNNCNACVFKWWLYLLQVFCSFRGEQVWQRCEKRVAIFLASAHAFSVWPPSLRSRTCWTVGEFSLFVRPMWKSVAVRV